jgi:hypothetical protein
MATPSHGAADSAAGTMELTIPTGAAVSQLALDGDRLAVYLAGPHGGEIVIIDLAAGRVLGRVRLQPR